MNHALTHSRIFTLPSAARLNTAAVTRHPAWREQATALSLAVAGGLALLFARALVTGLGVAPAQLPALFLVAGGILWMALALEEGRPLVSAAAATNLLVMVAGAYIHLGNATPLAPLYGIHLLLLGTAMLDRGAGRPAPGRLWSGVELTALALMVVHL